MPDYAFMCWDERTFGVDYCQFTKEAYSKKKYAYVADVARLCALYEYGGIYLDTDVEVFKRFDPYLTYDFFTGIELYREFEQERVTERFLNEDGTPKQKDVDIPHLEVLTSTMGSCSQNPLIKKVLDYYKSIEITEDLINDFRKYVIFDRLMARHLTYYGFRYQNKTQYLDNNMVVFGTGVFGYHLSPNPNYEISYHHNAASWGDRSTKSKTEIRSLWFDKRGLLPLYKKYKQCKKKLKQIIIRN